MVMGETKSFYCYPPIVGRYVSVMVPGHRKFLTICEVEVYSTPQTSNGVTGNWIYKIILFLCPCEQSFEIFCELGYWSSFWAHIFL